MRRSFRTTTATPYDYNKHALLTKFFGIRIKSSFQKISFHTLRHRFRKVRTKSLHKFHLSLHKSTAIMPLSVVMVVNCTKSPTDTPLYLQFDT